MTEVAYTPSSFEALSDLEYPRVLDVVAGYAASSLGAAAVRSRQPLPSAETAREELATVEQLARALTDGPGFEPEPVSDLTAALDALAAEGSVLALEHVRPLGAAITAMRRVVARLDALAEHAPRVAALAVPVPPAKLGETLTAAVDDDGTVRDDASPALKRARGKVRDARAELVKRLEQQLRALAGGGAAAGEVTLRDGRYVIPVRSDARGRVKGLVHGESASGATVFVEPTDAVELGNALTHAQAEEARAVQAVLRELTEAARPHRDTIAAGWHMAIAADDVYARARYMLAMESSVPELTDAPAQLVIVAGRHALLAERAVPFDLDLSAARTLVVSGPNAGGKTVLLKAVGLICAMAQAGVVPPVGKGTQLPAFRHVFVDIGDHQSIAASLSTFSAHVAALAQILTCADGASLVLLDEVGGGTDPIEGAALAGAVLLSLHGRGAVTLATTHLSQLTELAAAEDGVENASLEFDANTLAPTYRLLQGKPGRSYGLAIARRLGLADDVLAVAERLTPEAARTLDATLAELERREQQLRERELDTERVRSEQEALQARLERDRTQVDDREREVAAREVDLEKSGRAQARKFLLEARKRVEEALAVARAAVDEATAKEARRLVEEGVREEADELKRLEEIAREKGWRMKGAPPAPASGLPRAPLAAPLTAAFSEIDLRGLRADEAEAAVTQAVDAAVVAELPYLRIIHGKGTGALRDVVRRLLEHDRRLKGFHLAPPAQGGAGVTIVELGL